MASKRPDGDGTVRKRADGRWEGRIVIGHKADGAPIYKSVFAKTQKELMPKLHTLIDEYRGVEVTDCDMTLMEWAERWLIEYAEPTLRASTVERYRSYLKHHILPTLGAKHLRSITRTDVQKLYNSLAKKKSLARGREDRTLSGTMVVKIHMLLHEIMGSAVNARLIPRNPTEGAKLPKTSPASKTILSVEQLKRFMSTIREDAVWHDFFYTAMTTGLRKGEMCGLKWCDLDEDSGKLTVRRSVRVIAGGKLEVGETKTERGTRTILLPPGTLELLKERRKSSVSEWMFPDLFDPERPVSPNAAYRRLKKILGSAGLPDMRFHDIRHTFATHALAGGVDAKTLSGILGHASASFTLDTYTHVTTDMQTNAAVIVGGFMKELFGEELKPWQENARPVTEPSA